MEKEGRSFHEHPIEFLAGGEGGEIAVPEMRLVGFLN